MAATLQRDASHLIAVESMDGDRRMLRVPRDESTVGELRKRVAVSWHWPVGRTRLVRAGRMLTDDAAQLRSEGILHEEAVVRAWLHTPLIRTKQTEPPKPLHVVLRDGATEAWALLRTIPPRTATLIVLWILSAHLAGRAGFGNPYILLSCFVLVFTNLGERREGELSAYNVFNADFQELLGQLRLEHLEADLVDPHRIAARREDD